MTVTIRSQRRKSGQKGEDVNAWTEISTEGKTSQRFPSLCLQAGSVTAQDETAGVSSYRSRCNDWRISGFLRILLETIMDVFQATQTVNHYTSAVKTDPTFPVIFQLFILWGFFLHLYWSRCYQILDHRNINYTYGFCRNTW